MNVKEELRARRIIISQHTTFNWGPGSMLKLYLKDCDELLCIDHPFDIMISHRSRYELFEKGKLTESKKEGSTHTSLRSYIKDFFLTLKIVSKQHKRYDIFVGIDPLNALAGLVLKFFNKTKYVVFYPIDYSPRRFNNVFLNWLYHLVERYCAKHSDSVWFLAQGMIDEFVRKGANKSKCILTPVQIEKIFHVNVNERLTNPVLGHIGSLYPEKGVELLIETMPDIIKEFPNVKLMIIGSGPLENSLRKMINDYDLEEFVLMTGFIKSHNEALQKLSRCAIGLAPYKVDRDLYTGYGFGAKVTEYLACGLPIVITYWKEIEKENLGITIKYSKESLLEAVRKLLTDSEYYKRCSDNAYSVANEHHYENVFNKAFSSLLS